MRPEGRKGQAAMQMKRLSPENLHIAEADTVHIRGRRNGAEVATGETSTALPGSESAAWPQGTALGAWETQGESRKSVDTRRAASETAEAQVGEDKL